MREDEAGSVPPPPRTTTVFVELAWPEGEFRF
jgi:hypothetical protein